MEKILFIRLRLLGDIVFTIPALTLYRNHFPDTQIHYLVEERFREVADIIPFIDRVHVVDRKMGIKAHLDFRKKAKDIGFSTVVDFHSGPKSALLSRLTGARIRIGYRTPNRNWAYTHLTPRKPHARPTHSVYNQALLLAHLGITVTPRSLPSYPDLDFPGDLPEETADILKSAQPRIAIHVGAGNRFRDWGSDNFSELIRRLKNDGVTVFLIGDSEAERRRGRDYANGRDIINLTGKLSVGAVLNLIDRCDLYLGFDSGPLHLASLTGIPIVALYGPNLPEISGPWRKTRVTVLQSDLPCRPCSQKKCIYDTIRCVRSIKVDDVYNAIKKYI